MAGDLQRKNEVDLIKIQGEIRLLSERIDVIKNNDLRHLQKSLDFITKILWGVGTLVIGQAAIAIRLSISG
jgi:hypothetical protein|tara:strand:- start:355 stop:567 length:213 start_codon:yes stop_codon:yes gene_type:complete